MRSPPPANAELSHPSAPQCQTSALAVFAALFPVLAGAGVGLLLLGQTGCIIGEGLTSAASTTLIEETDSQSDATGETSGDSGEPGGCEAPTSVCGPSQGTVKYVIDGDTIELTNGLRIRYLNINAPESAPKVECYGLEAKEFNIEFLEGKQVCLHYDPAECFDPYDRLLAYVETDEGEVNTTMVELGYACAAFVGPSGLSRKAEFEALEAVARNEQRGLWATCDESVCDF